MVYSHDGTLYSNEHELSTSTGNHRSECHKYNVERKKPATKEYMVHYSIYEKDKNRQNDSMLLEIRIVVSLGVDEVSGRRPEGGIKDTGNNPGFAYTSMFSS